MHHAPSAVGRSKAHRVDHGADEPGKQQAPSQVEHVAEAELAQRRQRRPEDAPVELARHLPSEARNCAV
eukprot:6212313-Pleurochrysis_carterae.AAC.18